MDERNRYRRGEGERYPMRRLSSTGSVTSGWRSTLETGRDQGLGTFLIGSLIAGGVFALIAWLLMA
jgi:hypothetical protein